MPDGVHRGKPRNVKAVRFLVAGKPSKNKNPQATSKIKYRKKSK